MDGSPCVSHPGIHADLVDAPGYYADLSGTTDPTSTLNTGVRARIPQEPADRRMTVRHQGRTLLLDEYLRTRCVGLAVHTEDLALSLDSDVRAPAATLAVAVDVLLAAARRRHGDVAVMHALARRERDDVDALRVL